MASSCVVLLVGCSTTDEDPVSAGNSITNTTSMSHNREGGSDAGQALDSSTPADFCGMTPINESDAALLPNQDCVGSILRLVIRTPECTFPSAVKGTATIEDAAFEFQCNGSDAGLLGNFIDPAAPTGYHCQGQYILLWSVPPQHWDRTVVSVHVENPDTGSQADVGPVEINFTGTCGGASLNIVL
jgi:hypothetical protein